MKGLKLRTVVGLFCLVLCAAAVLVAHVWKQNAYVRISMEAVKLAKLKTQLRNDIALLDVSVGGLKKISRIEALAKGRFGLEYGKAPVLVYAGGEGYRDEDGSAIASAGIAQASAGGSGLREARGPESKGLESGKVAWRINGL
jgi:cell division protein FtsL